MALGKTLGEIRRLPAAEFRKWKTYYYMEPWGWENDEYLTSLMVSAIVNTNRTKGRAKKPTAFMRDIKKDFVNHIQREREKMMIERPDINTADGKKAAAEEIIRNVKRMFGDKVIDKRKEK